MRNIRLRALCRAADKLVLNVTRNIYDDVVKYIEENNLSIGRIINCTPSDVGATNY